MTRHNFVKTNQHALRSYIKARYKIEVRSLTALIDWLERDSGLKEWYRNA